MAVRRVKGVQKVDGDVKNKTLTVEFDSQMTSVDDIKKAMARVGYEADEV
jgi:copper chaperone CopZ